MLEEDYPVWERFLDQFGHMFERFYYDVRVGGPDPKTISPELKWGMMYYRLQAKRIDAIGEKKNEIWIIEVASRPGLRAVGQITSYVTLWALDPKIPKPAKAWLICERLDPDLAWALRAGGISYLVL